ncbi:MAG TPA: Ig-like domain-containing protein, partial [Candidatus Krumholzibacteria bacterium]|nr:Ig-like domain-containing protein [Candidatus Krumholzibacteria bacterium]
MAIRFRFSLVAAMLLALGLAACGSSSSPTSSGGGTDKTPPGVATVTPLDAYHVSIEFDEALDPTSAQTASNYVITSTSPPPVPAPKAGAAAGGLYNLGVLSAVLGTDKKTVTLTTELPMAGLDCTVSIDGVGDKYLNYITTPIDKAFTGSSNPDLTPPQLLSHTPLSNASNVPLSAVVTLQFSEPVQSFTWTWTYGGGSVSANQNTADQAYYTFTPDAALSPGTAYTFSISGVQDLSGNSMLDVGWSFTTTNTADTTPPTILAVSPTNLATNVDVNSNLSITFSEAVTLESDGITVVPDPGNGTTSWSNGNKTLTFDPDNPLASNQQYSITVYPNGVKDLSGNGILGVHTYVFTTDSRLAGGSIAGIISGDPGTQAANPAGATVVAANDTPFSGAFDILGAATVAGNDSYSIQHLTDGTYYLICVLDTNHNGNIDPSEGDAIGAYGVNFATNDFEPDSVVISGGTHATGINFPLYDPSAITGTVSYDGAHNEGHTVYVGIFETAGFDPTTSTPVAYTEAYWPGSPEWGINTLDNPLPDGNYYVAAYLDVNDNVTYDPATDAAGVYGGIATPTAIHIANGADISGINV